MAREDYGAFKTSCPMVVPLSHSIALCRTNPLVSCDLPVHNSIRQGESDGGGSFKYDPASNTSDLRMGGMVVTKLAVDVLLALILSDPTPRWALMLAQTQLGTIS